MAVNCIQQYGGTPEEILQLLNEKDDRIESLEKEVETHLELYNRQCVRANDLQEENNRLKEKLKSLDEEGNFWLNHSQSLDGENKRLKESVQELEAIVVRYGLLSKIKSMVKH